MKLLLHMCCGPCSIGPIQSLREQHIDFEGYFFNPNIHPLKEFKRRAQTLEQVARDEKVSVIWDRSYPLETFLAGALAEPELRCRYCYAVRLRACAEHAKEHGYDAFSTTLLVSPYQRHELIQTIAEQVAQEVGVPFYYQDFRPLYQEATAIAIAREYYRQPYCGCIFSERDRYEKKKKKPASA